MEISSVHSAYLDDDGVLNITAVIEDSVYMTGSQTLQDPPEYGPGLFETEIHIDLLPEDFDWEGMDEEQLKDVVMSGLDLEGFAWLRCKD